MEFLVFSPLIKHCIESHCGSANMMLFGSLQILIKIFSRVTLTCVRVWPVYLVCPFLPFLFMKSL